MLIVQVIVWKFSLQIVMLFNSVQTRCIVKSEAQKKSIFGNFLGVFDFLRSACSVRIPTREPLN